MAGAPDEVVSLNLLKLTSMDHLKPKEAYAFLAENSEALFIDCRTDAEYFFVGHAIGSIHVGWYDGPDWELNRNFIPDVKKLSGGVNDKPVVIICRSGKRSVEAGEALESAGFKRVINVTHGFEGDRNDLSQRGMLNGWRFDGLPWEQL